MIKAVEHILEGKHLDHESLSGLVDAFAEHPYSSSLAVILAKAYSLNDDVRFETHLRKTAILVNDRKQLHNFLFQEREKSVLETASSLSSNEDESISIDEEIKSNEPDDIQEIVDSEKKEKDPFLNQFITEALNAGAAIDLIEDSSEKIEEKEVEAKQPSSVEKHEPEVEIENATPSKQSFSHWMSFLNDVPEKDKPVPSILPRNEEEKKNVLSIIDSFIEKEDIVVPKRAEFFSPTKAAKASLQDNEDFVTETLAKIYAAQGNINKAISTYNKLSLLHPEKSSYFAALIEKLKSEKKDKS